MLVIENALFKALNIGNSIKKWLCSHLLLRFYEENRSQYKIISLTLISIGFLY